MSGDEIGILKAAATKMKYDETRQKVLSENIANANTAGYVPRDIKAPSFKELLATTSSNTSIRATTTDSQHISSTSTSTDDDMFKIEDAKDTYETTPTGNSVVLEEQLLKMNQNYIDHRLSTAIYKSTVSALKKSVKSN